MPVTSWADFTAAQKQLLQTAKTFLQQGQSLLFQGTWAAGTDPAAGSTNIGNTTTGLVPDNTTTGAIAIPQSFSANATLSWVDFVVSEPCRLFLVDRLFHIGPFSSNGGLSTFSSQPSFASRLPFQADGVTRDYRGLQIWCEVNVAVGNPAPTAIVTYTNQDGVTGHSGSRIAPIASGGQGTMWQIPLQSGDSGVQKIESLNTSGQAVGSYNVLVLRPLWGAVQSGWLTGNDPAGDGSRQTPFEMCAKAQVPTNACLFLIGCLNSSGVQATVAAQIQLANGLA